jgi:hypothetical protein
MGPLTRSNHPTHKECILLSLSSGRRRAACGILALVAALAVAAPSMASVPPVPETNSSSLNFTYSSGVGVNADSPALNFARKAG